MDIHVLALVLLAAAAHAGWNAWLKDSGDRLSSMAALAIGWLAAGGISAGIVGMPGMDAWWFLFATSVVHTAYALLLIAAYHHAEFSLAYPIARATGPLLVAIAVPVLVGEYLEGPGVLAVVLIVLGIFLIGLPRRARSLSDRRAILLSLATGILIAGYTIIDGQGARVASSPHAYAAWLFILTALPIIALARWKDRKTTAALVAKHWRNGIPVGVLSALTYWAILWAMSVAPIALVAAVRETSILFAALIGWAMLGERLRTTRWAGVVVTLAGLVLAKF